MKLKTIILFAAIAASAQGQIEPKAGSWKTWVLRSGSEIPVPPPPDAGATAAEIQWLKSMASQRDETTLRQIRYWDSGPASYRWIEQLANRFERPNTGAAAVVVNPLRVWTYLTVAMYDATIACWDAKYKYNRPRPSQVDATLTTAVANPATPSYPSEHAVVAGAASAILAYFYPDEAADLPGVAEEAARSRLTAGVDYPSDYFAGLELGRAVAARVIDRAKSDGALVPWTGTIPQGPGF